MNQDFTGDGGIDDSTAITSYHFKFKMAQTKYAMFGNLYFLHEHFQSCITNGRLMWLYKLYITFKMLAHIHTHIIDYR